MLFNDATAIKTEGKAKRKAIRDATLAEQKEMDDFSCDDKEWKRRMNALGEAEMPKLCRICGVWTLALEHNKTLMHITNLKEYGQDFWMTCKLNLLLNIMKFAPLNPKDHFNQVAITSRRNNIVWRRLVMNSENLRHWKQRVMLEGYIYDVIPRINDQIDFDVPVQQLHDLLALI